MLKCLAILVVILFLGIRMAVADDAPERVFYNARIFAAEPDHPCNEACQLSVSSLATGHLRCLFADLPRVNDEFEGVRILMLFHQFEVDEPLGVSHGSAVL